MIELKGVSKSYGEHQALAPTNLRFQNGQTTVLIGPSGCGKSTILRLINGLIKPDQGEVVIDGHLLTEENLLKRRRQMGYVIQEGGLFPHLTAEQNVWLMMRHLGEDVRDCVRRVNELCKLTRFPESLLTRFPSELSGGQRQRVSLMRALALDPPTLLLDEPLGALDPMVRNELQTELKVLFQEWARGTHPQPPPSGSGQAPNIQAEHPREGAHTSEQSPKPQGGAPIPTGKTVILVTHDLAEAGYLGDTIVLMREGRVIQQGTLEDLQKRPAEEFVERFVSAQRSLVQL